MRKPNTDPVRIAQTYYQESGRWLLKNVRARTTLYIWIIFRIGIRVELDVDVKSHRYFF